MEFKFVEMNEDVVMKLNALTLDSPYAIGKIKEITNWQYDDLTYEDEYSPEEFLSELLEYAAWVCNEDESEINPKLPIGERFIRVLNEEGMYWTMHIVYQETDGRVICVSYINGSKEE